MSANKRQEYNARYYEKNREHLREYARKYRRDHADEIRKKDRERCTGSEKRKSYCKEWRKKNPERQRALNAEYQRTHRDQIREKHNQWKKQNPERVKALSAKDYKEHRESRRKKHAEYAIKNREKMNAYRSEWNRTSLRAKEFRERYKARAKEKRREYYLRTKETRGKFQNDFDSRTSRRTSIYRKFDLCDGVCYICGMKMDIDDLHIDHVFPLGRNGGNDIQNLMPTHPKCNMRKGKRKDYPVKRPDLIELCKCVQTVPRAKRKTRTPEYA